MSSPSEQTPIFIVNLARSPDRMKLMAEQMERLGLEYRRVEAVDGNELSDAEIDEMTDAKISRVLFRRKLNPGEVGCHLSHMKIYQIMRDEGIAQAVIMEDDATLHDEFPQVLRRCLQAPLRDEWRLLHMIPSPEVRLWANPAHEKNIDGANRLGLYAGVIYGTVCYAIKGERAGRLLEQRAPCVMPIDMLLFDMALSDEFAHAVYWREGARCGQNRIGKVNESMPSLIRQSELELWERLKARRKEGDDEADPGSAWRAAPVPSLLTRIKWKLDNKYKSFLLSTVYRPVIRKPWRQSDKLHYNILLSGETRDYYPNFRERMRVYRQAARRR